MTTEISCTSKLVMNTKLECLALGRAKGLSFRKPSCVEIDFIVKARDCMTVGVEVKLVLAKHYLTTI